MNRIKKLRQKKGWHQTELAKTLGVSQATLSNWERGIHDPDNESLAKIAKIFNCTIDYLLMNSPEVYPIDVEDLNADNVYFRIAQEARESGISPHDLRLAIEFLKKSKERDNNL